MHLKVSSGKWRPFCLGLNALRSLVHRYRYGALQEISYVLYNGIIGLIHYIAQNHHSDAIVSVVASPITVVSIVCSTDV